ncbi:aspartate/glutamate racemase family protein [Luteimicrobium subarcticum]|uniref:Aspartate racemase n=1 Tax=Luteimicrobium subarcticum TaxID=620910 RepID=A0A2M8W1W3_9MICO|nr:amino acid racemase [Luteimicrobium subarcticum]PJI84906.1 aspartate racemase [Luteimicrobium subarcticum]
MTATTLPTLPTQAAPRTPLTLGILGGMSWHSTAEYYRLLNTAVAERLGGHHSARILLASVDFDDIRAQQVDGDWAGAGALLAGHARSLQDGGADVVMIATNLMHKVAPAVEAALDVPLLHIADAVAAAAGARGIQKLGILGSRWVMTEDFYADRLARHGIEVVRPATGWADDAADVDRIVFDELTQGIVRDESRDALVAVVRRLADAGAEGVVLGCTELDLLLDEDASPLPLVDSTTSHVAAAVAFALGDGDARRR